ncbi:MAG: hypothetical protein M5U07_20555 [Xanthobacteraceae bacterium]|nr:hypothetical protein [Xanthobacteraceae bacterium]
MSHPERLGKYRITETLGKGAMGSVKAFDPAPPGRDQDVPGADRRTARR